METFSSAAFFAWDEANRTAGAADLRSELLQTLTALSMDVGWLRAQLGEAPRLDEKLGEMAGLLRGAVASTERIATGLGPLILDDVGLVPAVEFLADEFARRTGSACELDLDELIQPEKPCATALFRIVQDWLRGLAADGARRVRIRMASMEGEVILQVRDDGTAPGGSGRTRALSIVKERARLLRGIVGLAEAAGAGMQLEGRIPCKPRDATRAPSGFAVPSRQLGAH